MKIAVLAVQGAFLEHQQLLHRLNVETVQIRQLKDLAQPLDGLIIPGGESTTMGKLLRELGMLEPLQQKITAGLPVFGTCAGLILLAQRLADEQTPHLATMDICAKRNAYGRQLGSFNTTAPFAGQPIPMTFIRAPYIESVGPEVDILATVDEKIVAARSGHQLATAFHPELTSDPYVHQYFLEMCR